MSSNENGDLPAMPITNNGVTMFNGLTKRESLAASVNPPAGFISTVIAKTYPEGCSIRQYAKLIAEYKAIEAEELLTALDNE